jgi:serine protease Do
VVKRVEPGSAAARAGLKEGDAVRLLRGVPVHSLADAQFALDRAPPKGTIPVTFERAGKSQTATLALAEGWRKTDITWRRSLRRFVPVLPLYGAELTAAEKKALGLDPKHLAFRQRDPVNPRAEAAGVLPGDVILGIGGKGIAGRESADLREYVSREYLVGDRVEVDVLRGGKRLSLPFTLRSWGR